MQWTGEVDRSLCTFWGKHYFGWFFALSQLLLKLWKLYIFHKARQSYLLFNSSLSHSLFHTKIYMLIFQTLGPLLIVIVFPIEENVSVSEKWKVYFVSLLLGMFNLLGWFRLNVCVCYENKTKRYLVLIHTPDNEANTTTCRSEMECWFLYVVMIYCEVKS